MAHPREDTTELERRVEAEVRKMLASKYPRAIPYIQIRLDCTSPDPVGTGLHCEKPSFHEGDHYLFSKGRSWTNE